MALQGKIKKKLVLTDPGHTVYVSCSGITFIPNFFKITNSEVEKGEYVPRGNMMASQAYTFLLRMELSDQKEGAFSFQVVNKLTRVMV
jgi:hypothetical protein